MLAFPRIGRLKTWLIAGTLCAAVAVLVLFSHMPRRSHAKSSSEPTRRTAVKIVGDTRDTLRLSPSVISALGIRTHAVDRATNYDRLTLSGSLFLDSNRLVRIHSRFAGEVETIANNDGSLTKDGVAPAAGVRPLRAGDAVKKDQLLAVVWSKDVGEKKSDLVNHLSQLYLDKAQLQRLKTLEKGVVPERTVREAERQHEADLIAVDRDERTLRSWKLTESEVAVVRSEAEQIHHGDNHKDLHVDKSWAEVDVRAPFDGVVLEKNVTKGDIVDSSLDLFKIADLSVMGVMANVYEEDLPALESLSGDKRVWKVQLKSQAAADPISGKFEVISNLIDPNQHTAAVIGWLDNSTGGLRAGQFITATIDLPAAEGEVSIPESALIEDGAQSTVFVAGDNSSSLVTRRKVAVSRRSGGLAFIRMQPTPAQRKAGAMPLEPGELVVTSGIIELAGALENELAKLPSSKAAVQ